MIYNNFGDKLKDLRKSRNLTQEEFGREMGLSKAVVSKYENYMGYPTYNKLIRIAKYFGVTTDYLLGATEHMKSVDISGLTDSQIDIIQKLISEFQNTNQK